MERAVSGRIFQALPTQTDTVALIYKIQTLLPSTLKYKGIIMGVMRTWNYIATW